MSDRDRRVKGPLGRTFNRILGKADNAEDTSDMAFNRDLLKTYLDEGLQLAEDEWFRGKKLNGVADALMAELDKDGDGSVSWDDFQSFKDEVAKAIGNNPDERFDTIDHDDDGGLTMGEVQATTRHEMPEDTKHKDLIAQLGARITMDAVDTDQRDAPVKNRRLSRTEWTNAASELNGG